MKNHEIKQAFKNLPDIGIPDNEQVMCREHEQCDGCNYRESGSRSSNLYVLVDD